MTIAAGLLCQEGVLLCADTEETSWATKSHASKIREFEFPGGRAAFAYAGNTRFASSAIQKCKRKLTAPRKEDPKKAFDPLAEIEDVLDKEYRRNVLTHPSQASDPDLHYWVLIALWIKDSPPATLYVTEKTAIDEVRTFECIGIGEPLARHLIRPAHHREMGYTEALPLAAYALALVKDQMRDCDGMSIFSLLGNDGSINTVTSIAPGPCSQVEHYARGYDFLTRRLLVRLTDPSADEQYFEINLENTFTEKVRDIFREILADRKHRENEMADRNPTLTIEQVKQLTLQWSMGLQINLPPSPESHGGSGES